MKHKPEIKPYGKWILILPQKGGEQISGGLVGAQGGNDKTEAIAIKGQIVALPEGKNTYHGLDLGTTVFVARWEVQKAKVGTTEYILAKKKHVLGVIPNGGKK